MMEQTVIMNIVFVVLLLLTFGSLTLSNKNITGPGLPNIYICEHEDPTFRGQYLPGDPIDGVSKFENDEGKAIWRHQGFWYMGDLSVGWPPETHYRCVENCKCQEELPPTTGYQPRTKSVPPPPSLQFKPCEEEAGGSQDEL